jgi:hypothetical protein
MNNSWDNLPNAIHINWVLKSVKNSPRAWADAGNDAVFSDARDPDDTYGAAYHDAYDAACDAADAHVYAANRARDYATSNAYHDAGYAGYASGTGVSNNAILALIAYNNSSKYLDMSYQQLLIFASLSNDPAAILLLPAVKARELINEKNKRNKRKK